MATFSISATARKAQASGNGSAGPFSFAFQVNSQAEVDVFVDTTLKTLTTHYTVSLASNGTGTVSFTTNNFPSSSQTITIMGDAPLSRTSVYTSGGNITAAALESDFDTNVMVQQQQQEVLSRTVRAPVDDAASVDLTLPNKDDRKGKVLGFNSTTGNPEVTTQVTGAAVNVSTVSVGGNATGSVAVSGGTATFALGIPTGATGLTGATGQAGGGLANIVSDTTPQLGGNLDMNGKDIVTVSNATLDLAPAGTGTVVVRGNTNSGAVVFNCESNTHGQKVFGQPHSASVTNTLMLPAGNNSTLVSRVSVDTLTNKTLAAPVVNGGAVFNEDSADVDFRVESNGNANMVFVDGGNNKVAIGTATATAMLTVAGSLKPISYEETYVALTAGSTVTLNLAAATNFSLTMAQGTTFAFSNPPGSGTAYSFTLMVTQHSSAVTITWPSSVDWAGGSAPAAAGNNEVQAYAFLTRDGGTTYYGFLGGTAIG